MIDSTGRVERAQDFVSGDDRFLPGCSLRGEGQCYPQCSRRGWDGEAAWEVGVPPIPHPL